MGWDRAFKYLAIALCLFISDALLKAYVHYNVPLMNGASYVFPYDGIGVFRDWHGIDFCITHVINKGAAWGVFSSIHQYLLYARVLIIGGLLTYLLFMKGDAYRKFCLMLIVVGASGNVIDHFVYGHVVDMFYFTFWGYSYPVFNIADSAIFCGVALLLLKAGWQKVRRPRLSSQSSD